MSTRPRTPVRTRLATWAVTATVAAALAGCGDETAVISGEPTGGTTAAESPSVEPDTDTEAPTESISPDTGSGTTTTVPVYFIGDTPQGPRLFREFRTAEGSDPLAAAAALATSGGPLDPDYRSGFPAGSSFASVTYDEAAKQFVATLPDDTWTDGSDYTREEARLAVQQLVYTLQGVQQQRAPLVVELDGEPTSLLGVDTTGGVDNVGQLEVLALVSISDPAQGAVVSGSLTATGVASSFEANVPWEVRRGDEVVLEGFATANGWMDRLYPWETVVDVSGLAPGSYTFAAMTDDPTGGAEGPGATEDTRTIVVE